MGKSKVLKKAIELLEDNQKGLTSGTFTDHEGLVAMNGVLLMLLLEDSK